MYEISEDDRLDITRSLMEDYTLEEIIEMLDDATFKEDSTGIIVVYANGFEDRFVYTRRLVHENDL